MKKIAYMLVISCIMSLFTGCANNKKTISKSGFYFDTVIAISLYEGGEESDIEECFALAEQYEQLLSRTIETSDVSKINESNGAYVTVSQETLELIQLAINYSKQTDGAFDVTIGGVSENWDFKNEKVPPNQAVIQDALQGVNYKNIEIIPHEKKVRLLHPQTKIDLGGIAKGYIADQMKLLLKKNGVKSGVINLGGNVLTIGIKSDRNPYRIGIKKPFGEATDTIATANFYDGSMVSSGIYERYFEHEGKRYHHILDSNTGYPVENDLLGVTIYSKESSCGDALSTGCMVMGLEKGLEFIEKLEDVEALFIKSDYSVVCSSGFPIEQ